MKEIDDPNKLTGVTNMSTVTTVKPEQAGDFVVNSDGQLRVFDGQGYVAPHLNNKNYTRVVLLILMGRDISTNDI